MGSLSGARARILVSTVLVAALSIALLAWKVGPASGAAVSDEVLSNPSISGEPLLIGKRHIAVSGSLSAILTMGSMNDPWLYVRDAVSGANGNVPLPPSGAWTAASYTLRARDDLWVLSGTGPIELREYHLTGSPLPTTATLVSTTTLGDADSRPDDLLTLASGALIAVWHQQGSIGPQALAVSYWSPWSPAWSTLYPLTFMPTFASKFVVAQHPVDGSIWVFGNPDSWGAIGVAHLTELPTFVRLDWTNAQFISSADGVYNADPENPDLEVSTDPGSGSVVLTYESIVRKMFSTSPVVTGSYLAVAAIGADGTKSFTSMNRYVERVSSLGLSVQPSGTWVSYRAVEPDLTFTTLFLSAETSSGWTTPVQLGTLYSPYQQILSNPSAPEFVTRLSDGKVHIFRATTTGPLPSASPSDSPTPTPTDTTSPAPAPSDTPTPTVSPTPTPAPTVSATPTAAPAPKKCRPSKNAKCR